MPFTLVFGIPYYGFVRVNIAKYFRIPPHRYAGHGPPRSQTVGFAPEFLTEAQRKSCDPDAEYSGREIMAKFVNYYD